MKNYNIKVNGKEYSVKINGFEEKFVDVTVNDKNYKVEIESGSKNTTSTVQKANKPSSNTAPTPAPAASAPKPQTKSGSGNIVKSPLPGTVLQIFVKEGDSINVGQVVMELEAMKMENNITSEFAGIVEKVHFYKGDSVMEGDILITIK